MKLSIPVSLMVSVAVGLPADLPVKQVVLYKHGVGFFERAGTLAAGRIRAPRFQRGGDERRAEIAHHRHERRQDHRSALRFHGSAEPQAGGVPVPDRWRRQSLAAMLDQLKGARVELKLGHGDGGRRHRQRPHVRGHGQAARARTAHSDAGHRRDAHRGPGRRHAACASPTRNCSSSSRITWRRSRPRGPRTSAASTSIPPTPGNARSRPAT